MVHWATSCLFLFLSVSYLSHDIYRVFNSFQAGRRRKPLERVIDALRELEETLLAGLIPTQEQWGLLNRLPEPWGKLTYESVHELRSCGGSLLPTLHRIRNLVEDHVAALGSAQAKGSQALVQVGFCFLLVPLLGSALYALLPALDENPKSWFCACGIAMTLSSVGAIWLFRMIDSARWGGFLVAQRSWILSSQCAGERFLALVRTGAPPDLAWTRICSTLHQETPELAFFWGNSVWESPKKLPKPGSAQCIQQAGESIKKAVHISLMEGRPCLDRVEGALVALRQGRTDPCPR